MKRRDERELALKILYALEYNSISVEDLIDELDPELKKNASDFALKIINVGREKKEELDDLIKAQLFNWDFSRVAIIDKILLRMALAELLHFNDVPAEVTLNEVIEISKIYSTERSGKFINGILDAILKKIRAGEFNPELGQIPEIRKKD